MSQKTLVISYHQHQLAWSQDKRVDGVSQETAKHWQTGSICYCWRRYIACHVHTRAGRRLCVCFPCQRGATDWFFNLTTLMSTLSRLIGGLCGVPLSLLLPSLLYMYALGDMKLNPRMSISAAVCFCLPGRGVCNGLYPFTCLCCS